MIILYIKQSMIGGGTRMYHILVVEDDKAISHLLYVEL